MHKALSRIQSRAAVAAVLLLALLAFTLRFLPVAYASTVTYEAESATLTSGAVVQTDHTGYTGSGFVGGYTDANKGIASTKFTVSASTAGSYTSALRFANGTGSSKTLSLYVNNTKLRQTTLGATANWDSWGTVSDSVTLTAGANTLTYKFDTTDSGNVNIDNIALTSVTTPTGGPEAENAVLSGGAVVQTDHTGYTGTGFVGGYTDANKGAASTKFTVSSSAAGTATATLRYANGTGVQQSLSIYVNGTKALQTLLPATANWDTWSTKAETLTLTAGSNTVNYRFDTSDSGNVNLDSLTMSGTIAPPPPPPVGPAGYTYCANENGTCDFAGTASVAYGYNANWVYKTATSSIACNNATFGDPAPGVGKACFYQAQSSGTGATYEAEKAFFSGGPSTATSIAGPVGGSYVTGFTAVGARVIFTVNSSVVGAQSVQLRYADSASRTISVYVNGIKVHVVTLASSGNAWASATDSLTLRTGLNTIAYQLDSGDSGNVSIDDITLPTGSTMAAVGATLPYQEVEAEAGATNATVLAAGRAYNTISSESSGRRAIQLNSTGNYVQFTLAKPANSVVIRYVIPDTGNGANYTPTLGLYIGGTRTNVTLTNRYSWTYGGYPFNNDPSQGNQHHFYDEVRVKTANMAAGTVVKLQKDAGDTAGYYVIDLVDFEQVDAAYAMPANYLTITSYGATPNDGSDDTTAINNAIAAAKSQGKELWIPAGQFEINNRVNLDHVTLRGAGPWYSVLHGINGKGGLFVTGANTQILDLAVSGDSVLRNDCCDDAGIEGNFATGSLVQNVWLEHGKVGMWVDSGTNGLDVVGVRIRDTWADGINIHGGATGVLFTQSNVRNTGDDAMAMDSEGGTDTYDSLTFNTTQDPVLANNAAVYGGGNMRIEDNLLSDTVAAGGGVNVSTAFGNPFNGPVWVQRNTLNRTGSREPNLGSQYGGIWIFAKQSNITTPVTVNDNIVNDSTYAGILLNYHMTITGASFNNDRITTTGTYGIEIISAGSGTFSNVVVTGAPSGGLSVTGGYTVNRGSGNSGF